MPTTWLIQGTTTDTLRMMDCSPTPPMELPAIRGATMGKTMPSRIAGDMARIMVPAQARREPRGITPRRRALEGGAVTRPRLMTMMTVSTATVAGGGHWAQASPPTMRQLPPRATDPLAVRRVGRRNRERWRGSYLA